ncbi:endonuclease III [Rubricoccus marinus]|uniref:Endonuclease III n=1 Tax=Rubricoccus marinus TaxID=716817 RepID=A0A259TVL2_9BACT|nr:endonuclease III [Rubricoccus marinus]OZC01667.1 endonuclease III [Rubricoccus marinus]
MTRKEKARLVLDRLSQYIPQPETELDFGSEFQLLIAVILSAQCTDKRVNMVTPALFEAYPTARAMAEAEAEDIFPFIASVSYPNNKAKALAKTARMLRDEYGGEVPREHAELVKLAGVGRKTANVVVQVAFGEAAIAVDTHVFRVANRIGLVKDQPTPLAVEKGLRRVLPREEWGEAHHLFILHGRYTCEARAPKCDRCPLTDLCDYYAKLQALPDDVPGLDAKKGRYWSKTTGRYFDEPATKTDRYGVEQLCEPSTGSMNLFDAKTGRTTKKVRDYRV